MNIEGILRGGLGNQLFQYAFMRNLQTLTSGEMHVDTFWGFRTDYRYHNKFQLSGLLENCRNSLSFRSMELAIVEKLASHFSYEAALSYLHARKCEFLFDVGERFVSPNLSVEFPSVFLYGYWQSHLYFKENESLIGSEIANWLKKKAGNPSLKADGTQVGIGIRTYSETRNPSLHSRSGSTVNSYRWQIAIDQIMSEIDNANFVIFTRDTQDLSMYELNFRGAPVVIHDSTGRIPVEVMFDYASCDYHIFNNSTFYWWGAYLNKFLKPNSRQIVYTSDSYLNLDAIPGEWKRF